MQVQTAHRIAHRISHIDTFSHSICSTLLVHHFIISGWKGVKDTLAGLAQQHGVEIKTNVAVEEVIVSGGRAVGVKLPGGVEESLGADQLAKFGDLVELETHHVFKENDLRNSHCIWKKLLKM